MAFLLKEIIKKITGPDVVNDGDLMAFSGTDGKLAKIAGPIPVSKIKPLTGGKALVSCSDGLISESNTTSQEIGFLKGVKSNIQTQIDEVLALDNLFMTLTAPQVTTSTTYAALAGMSVEVGIGQYEFNFYSLFQTAASTTGIGVRIAQGTALLNNVYAQWQHVINTTGGSDTFDQIGTASNHTSLAVPAANTDLVLIGRGIFQVSSAGTVIFQFRTEVAASAATLQTATRAVIRRIA
jgi:hypothetical protein